MVKVRHELASLGRLEPASGERLLGRKMYSEGSKETPVAQKGYKGATRESVAKEDSSRKLQSAKRKISAFAS